MNFLGSVLLSNTFSTLIVCEFMLPPYFSSHQLHGIQRLFISQLISVTPSSELIRYLIRQALHAFCTHSFQFVHCIKEAGGTEDIDRPSHL